jgi:saccharopine dehydrogenase-like NADP-dependent oxidoreductase
VIVLGGSGLFGRTAVQQLRAFGIQALTAARATQTDIRVDANDRESLLATCKPGDLVIDAAGPFQQRSTALIETAIAVGFDVIDLNDDLGYAEKVLARESAINQSDIRVLSSASSVSAVSAAAVKLTHIAAPVRVTAFLAPASRHTANAGTARSLIASVGRPVRVLRGGELRTQRGWGQSRSFRLPEPLGPRTGWLFESADAIYLPRIWPSLQTVDMYVDTNVPGANTLLRAAARLPMLRSRMESQVHLGTSLSRRLGSNTGGIAYEVESAAGKVERIAFVSKEQSFLIAVAPAVLAANAIVDGNFESKGLVLPDRQVDANRLVAFLDAASIRPARLPDE